MTMIGCVFVAYVDMYDRKYCTLMQNVIIRRLNDRTLQLRIMNESDWLTIKSYVIGNDDDIVNESIK